jgi:general secretion pathway protein D
MAMVVCIGRAWSADADLVRLNFVNADIEGVVKAVSEITGKNFVLDPRVKGTVNIVSAKPVSRALIYEIFLAALRVQGYAAIESRGIVRIVPESDAKLQSSPTRGPQDRPLARGDQIQTQVFTLKYESAVQMVPILRPLIAPNNTITAYPATNTLVITDYAGNLERIEKIIDSIDQPSGTEPMIIPLRHASALDVAQTLNRLFTDTTPAAGDPTQRLVVVADARSNSLIVRSDNPSRLFRLRSLLATLDSPTSAAGNIHVVHLKNAEAVKVAETLRAIYHGDAAARPAQAATSMSSAPMLSQGPGATASPAVLPLAPSGLGQAPASASAAGIIQADAATNSIIINAPDAIYNNLRAALDKLDVRRAQVYVEALIAEITADKAAEFGIQWQDLSALGSADSSARGFGGTNFGGIGQNILGLSVNPATAGRGLNIGVARGRVTIPGIGEVINLGVLVRALETDSNANILSTPTLLTLDNEEARIVIGQNVPFITGQYALTGAATTPTPFQTIERKDVGLTLRIKPQISEGGTVRLQIYQEVSSVVDTLVTPSAGPTTNKRAVETTVLVDDGQIVVIGGLIQDSVKDGVEKVPLLGDIPLLGALFQYKTRSRSKTNLMVFLRPVVVRDGQGSAALSSERYEYILGEQRKARLTPSLGLPDVEAPALPPRQPPAPADSSRPQ